MIKFMALVGLGGSIGSMARYAFSRAFQHRHTAQFPIGTFMVNIIGGLLIGVLIGLVEKSALSPEWRLLLVTGFCGGLTTFSAFSLESYAMLRDGLYVQAASYIIASVIFSIGATCIGFAITKG